MESTNEEMSNEELTQRLFFASNALLQVSEAIGPILPNQAKHFIEIAKKMAEPLRELEPSVELDEEKVNSILDEIFAEDN